MKPYSYDKIKVELYMFNRYFSIRAVLGNWAWIHTTDLLGHTKNNPKSSVPHFTSNEAFLFFHDHLRLWKRCSVYDKCTRNITKFLYSEYFARNSHIENWNLSSKNIDGKKDKLYCFCNSPYSSNETLIGCDSEKCKWEWFHLSCVNLKWVPKNNWYYPVCHKRKVKNDWNLDAKNKKRET